MKFCISEELEMTRSVLREFSESEIAPKSSERDEKEQFDRSLFDKMGQLGITAIPIDDFYGGAGSNWLTFAIVIEELARVCASTAAMLASHTIFTAWPIYTYGSEELKSLYLKELAMGAKLGACVLPTFITSKGEIASSISASSVGDHWELNGVQGCAIQAESADYCLVFAQLEHSRRKPQLSAFLLERGIPGLCVGERVRNMGLRSFSISDIKLDHCRISHQNKIGKDGQGHEMALSLMDISHISAAAQAVGIAQGAFEAAAAYAKERKQYGTVIGKQQGISFKLADMSTQLEAARLLTYQAAWRKDEGLPFSKEAAIARKFSAETAVTVAIEAVQIFGGYGYMQEFRMERLLRDAKCLETELGTGGMDTGCIYRMLKD